ncbi:MAG: hypothetical protein H6711_23855 [Myxococcales bacterium]|nr:hypothetical protein [Myxococcales bacterium]
MRTLHLRPLCRLMVPLWLLVASAIACDPGDMDTLDPIEFEESDEAIDDDEAGEADDAAADLGLATYLQPDHDPDDPGQGGDDLPSLGSSADGAAPEASEEHPDDMAADLGLATYLQPDHGPDDPVDPEPEPDDDDDDLPLGWAADGAAPDGRR